jgi:hypothetical protein
VSLPNNNNNKVTKIKRDGLKNCEAKAGHKYESKDKLEGIEKEDVRNDEASNTLEISEDTENVVNTHDNRTQEDMVADHDLEGKHTKKKKKTPWSESASELYRPSDRRLSAKRLPTFADKECHVVRVTDPFGRILGFLDRSRYFSIK